MKTIYFKLLCLFMILFISCDKDVTGCMDNLACNFNPDATENDNSCLYASDNPIEINFFDGYEAQYVSGATGDLLEISAHITNMSCEAINDLVVNKVFNNPDAFAYFCFNGTCFSSSVSLSPNPQTLDSFEQTSVENDNYFKAYFRSEFSGTYQVLYDFYLQDNPDVTRSISLTFHVN